MAFLAFIGKFFRRLFGKGGWLRKDVIPHVIEVVNNIKTWDEQNPEFADLLTAIIPGTWDDELKLKMRSAFKVALEQAAIFTGCLELEDDNAKIQCIVKQLQSITNADTKAFKWAEIAAYATKYIADDDKLDINEIAALVKLVYENINVEDEA